MSRAKAKPERRSRALTLDELATLYDKHHGGRKARTLPISTVCDWAVGRTDLFRVADNDSIELLL